MTEETFRDRNRRKRQQNAFENLYEYARKAGIPDPKRSAERAARRLNGAAPQATAAAPDDRTDRSVPHRLDDRTRDQVYARAQELDIQGRSQMSKDELIEAIRDRN